MRVIDLNTMTLTELDMTWDCDTEYDFFYFNQSLDWHGKVYMLGKDHIHVITKDCLSYECIRDEGDLAG